MFDKCPDIFKPDEKCLCQMQHFRLDNEQNHFKSFIQTSSYGELLDILTLTGSTLDTSNSDILKYPLISNDIVKTYFLIFSLTFQLL